MGLLVLVIYLIIGSIISLGEYAFHCWNYKNKYNRNYKDFSYYKEQHSMEGILLIFAWPIYLIVGIPFVIYQYCKKQIEKRLL